MPSFTATILFWDEFDNEFDLITAQITFIGLSKV
jgi:hypothetical protein